MMSARARGVLITDGNERSALAATRALGQRGIPVCVGADTVTSLAGRSRYCTRTFQYPSPWSSPREYTACVLEFAMTTNAAVVLPMTDVAVELLGEHSEALKGILSIPIASLSRYRQLSNKYALTHWAKENGVPVPESIFLPDGAIDKVVDQVTRWPVVVKPGASLIERDGLWTKTSVHVARNADELMHLYAEHWYLKHPSIVQQRITGEGQGIFGLFSQGRPLALFSHRRIREKPPGGGVSVLRESIPLGQPITGYAIRILQSAQWQGVAMVEFKVDRESGVPYLMEVNGRFWGSLQLAIDAGVDFPFLTYQLATDGRLESVDARYRVGVKSRWFLGDLDHLLLRLRKSDEQLGLPPGSPTKSQAMREFLRCTDRRTQSEVFRLGDPGPGLYEAGCYLRQLVRTLAGQIWARTPDVGAFGARAGWALVRTLGLQTSWLRKHVPQSVGKILVLCKGNVCRSPFAAELLRQRVHRLGLTVQVTSAGIEAASNQEAYPLAKRLAQQYGVSLSAHRTTPLSPEMVYEADLILVMDAAQARSMRKRYPYAVGKLFLLSQFTPGADYEIQDPYGDTAEVFARCYDQISKACDYFLSFLTCVRQPRAALADREH